MAKKTVTQKVKARKAPKMTPMQKAMGTLALIGLSVRELQASIRLHGHADDGAWANIVEMNLAGEDAQAYYRDISGHVEGMAHDAQSIGREVHELLEFFTRNAKVMTRAAVR